MKKIVLVFLLGALMVMGVVSARCYAASGTTVAKGVVFTPDGYEFILEDESNVEVYLENVSSEELYSTEVTDDGSYSFTEAIPAGSYYLYAYAYGVDNAYADSEMYVVEVKSGVTLSQDLFLTNPSVAGRVNTSYGDAFIPETDSSVYVYLYDESGNYLEMDEVFEDGTYRVSGNYPEGTYYIRAFAYGSKNDYMHSAIETISIDPNETLQTDLDLETLILKGEVNEPNGELFTGYDTEVTVCLNDKADPTKEYSSYVFDGEYRFGSEVPDGDYEIIAKYVGDENMSDSDTESVSLMSYMSIDLDLSLNNSGYENSISGYLKPDFVFTDNNLYQGFKVEVVGKDISVITDDKGYFEIPDAQSGWVLKISKAGYLEREISVGDIIADKVIGTQSQPVLLWAGDLPVKGVQDQAVNMLDIMELAKAFNCTKGDAMFNQAADFNMDNSINMIDVMVIAKSFNKTSADYAVVK